MTGGELRAILGIEELASGLGDERENLAADFDDEFAFAQVSHRLHQIRYSDQWSIALIDVEEACNLPDL
jgi:hypothetical protein